MRSVLRLAFAACAVALPAFASAAERPVTRAEFASMLYPAPALNCYEQLSGQYPISFTNLYTDVHVDASYGLSLCEAMRGGVVKGYKDGSFHPNSVVTLSDAAAMLSRHYALAPYAAFDTRAWFVPHAEALAVRNAIPMSITSFGETITEDEAIEMLARLQNGNTWSESQTFNTLWDNWTRTLRPAQGPVVKPDVPAKPVTSSASSMSSKTSVSSMKTSASSAVSIAASSVPSSVTASSVPMSAAASSMPTSTASVSSDATTSSASSKPWYEL